MFLLFTNAQGVMRVKLNASGVLTYCTETSLGTVRKEAKACYHQVVTSTGAGAGI